MLLLSQCYAEVYPLEQVPILILDHVAKILNTFENLLIKYIIGFAGVIIILSLVVLNLSNFIPALTPLTKWKRFINVPKGIWFLFGYLGVELFSVLPFISSSKFPAYMSILLSGSVLLDQLTNPCKRWFLIIAAIYLAVVGTLKLGWFGTMVRKDSFLYKLINMHFIFVLGILLIEHFVFDFDKCLLK